MDDTTTATPPPTAASAAAVADTKVSPGPAHHHAAAMDNSSNLELVIKSSNQQYDDIVVKSDLLWTVRHLKKQLSIVYPGKPLIEDQKLIYSGKLLKDAEKLNEVIRNYKDVFTQKHIFHLVCASRNAGQPNPKTTTTATTRAATTTTAAPAARNSNQTSTTMGTHIASSNDGLRQRNIGQQQQQQQPTQQQQQRSMPTPQQLLQQLWQQQRQFNQVQAGQAVHNATQANPSIGGLNVIPTSTTPGLPYGMPGFGQQQFHAVAMYNAWMQQTYAQYMQQMMHGYSAETAAIPPNPYLQQLPYVVPFVREGSTQTPVITPAAFPGLNAMHDAAATAVPSAANVAQERQPAAAAAQAAAAVQANAAEQPAAQQPAGDELAAQRRFPNIQEEPENRDWLENFFALTRLAIFVTVLYFNSSPLRCLLVVLIASGIYLYHIGVLRRQRERNNNNINRNNNAAAEAAAQIQRFMDEQNVAAQPGAAEPAMIHPPNEPHDAVDVDGDAVAADVAAGADAGIVADAGVAATPAGGAANGIAIVQPENSATVISIVRTFVVTFFTSLLPEAPAV